MFEKVKKVVNEHKMEIVIGVLSIITISGGTYYISTYVKEVREHNKIGERILEALSTGSVSD